jgi:hypothetical protein
MRRARWNTRHTESASTTATETWTVAMIGVADEEDIVVFDLA